VPHGLDLRRVAAGLVAIIPASHAVRSEWSVGWPMLRSPMKASARTASKDGDGGVVGHGRA
jgi:hypothetical protein